MLISTSSLSQARASHALISPQSSSQPKALEVIPQESFVASSLLPKASESSVATAPGRSVEDSQAETRREVTEKTATTIRHTASATAPLSMEELSFSAPHEGINTSMAELSFNAVSAGNDSAIFEFSKAWLSKIPKGESVSRGAVQAAILESVSQNPSGEFALGDVKGVLASALGRLDRDEDQRILKDSLFKTLSATDTGGNALEVGKRWNRALPVGELGVRAAITDVALASFLEDPEAELELSNFKPSYDAIMAQLDRDDDQRLAADAFFGILSKESDATVVEMGRAWLSRFDKEEKTVRAAITDQVIERLLTDGEEMEVAEFPQFYTQTRARLDLDEHVQDLNDGLFKVLTKETDSSLLQFGKAWLQSVPFDDKTTRRMIVNGVIETFLANPSEEHDVEHLSSIYHAVLGQDELGPSRRDLNDSFFQLVKESDTSLMELAKGWTKSIPAGERNARAAVTDGVLSVFLKEPGRQDYDSSDLRSIYDSVMSQVGLEEDQRVLNDALLRSLGRESDGEPLLELAQGWAKAIPVEHKWARAIATDLMLERVMDSPETPLESSELRPLADEAVKRSGRSDLADDVVSGMLKFLARQGDLSELGKVARLPHSPENLKKKLDALTSLEEASV